MAFKASTTSAWASSQCRKRASTGSAYTHAQEIVHPVGAQTLFEAGGADQ